jgi:hypothetical protein
MTDRRYSDEEVAAIFQQAAEAPSAAPLSNRPSEGLTLRELQEIGREVGLTPEAVAQAARTVGLPGRAVFRGFAGLPIGVERSVLLDRRLTDAEWEYLVVELREQFQARGTMSAQGSLRQWTNGNLQALLEPTPTGDRLRLRTINGAARASMTTGLFIVGVSGAVAAATALSGQLGDAIPGIAFLLLTGLGMFGSGALRLPLWARRRRRQMEAIAARLLLPPVPLPPTLPASSSD